MINDIEDRMHLLTGLLEDLMHSELRDFGSSNGLLNEKGTYLIYYKRSEPIYAGKSSRLKDRLFREHLRGNKGGSHFRKSLFSYLPAQNEREVSDFVRNECSFRTLVTTAEYRNLEHFAIAILRPPLNNAAGVFGTKPRVDFDQQKETFRLKSLMNSLLSSQSYKISDILTSPMTYRIPGVYVITSNNDVVNYVGESGLVSARTRIHSSSSFRRWLGSTDFDLSEYKLRYLPLADVRERRYLEHFLIGILNPPFNK